MKGNDDQYDDLEKECLEESGVHCEPSFQTRFGSLGTVSGESTQKGKHDRDYQHKECSNARRRHLVHKIIRFVLKINKMFVKYVKSLVSFCFFCNI